MVKRHADSGGIQGVSVILRKVGSRRIGILVSTALILSIGGMARAESGDDLLLRGVKAYEDGEYQRSIDVLNGSTTRVLVINTNREGFATNIDATPCPISNVYDRQACL